jgi:hypothetical protein
MTRLMNELKKVTWMNEFNLNTNLNTNKQLTELEEN